MCYHAENLNLKIDNNDMDYITFGSGKKNLIMIPGLGDALKTVKGTAVTFALTYKIFAQDYKVYVFSRKNQMHTGETTRDMARDLAVAMQKLGISKAYVLGISEGGMIAQYLAIDYPELVESLVLAVTLCKQNETSVSTITSWIDYAEANDFNKLFIDTAERTYTEKKLKFYRKIYPLLCRISKPKSLERFIIQAHACLTHDSSKEICNIKCPTYVIGGTADQIVGSNSSREISELLPECRLKLYEGLGHSTYEEAKDFNQTVKEFFAET